MTPDSSAFIIARDPFRAIRRGRQLFQRKFTRAQGQGPLVGDGAGRHPQQPRHRRRHVRQLRRLPRPSSRRRGLRRRRGDPAGQPRRTAPVRPGPEGDAGGRDHRGPARHPRRKPWPRPTPRAVAVSADPVQQGHPATAGSGPCRTAPWTPRRSSGVNGDLRVRPFFFHGGTISIREFAVGALQAEMGLQAVDPELAAAAHNRARITTPAGMVLDGALDHDRGPAHRRSPPPTPTATV